MAQEQGDKPKSPTDIQLLEISRRLANIENGQAEENKLLRELAIDAAQSKTDRADMRADVAEIKRIQAQQQNHTHDELKPDGVVAKLNNTVFGIDSRGGLVAQMGRVVIVGIILSLLFSAVIAPLFVGVALIYITGRVP